MSSILLVDDDAEVLAVLGRFSERRGWNVVRAAAGADGIEAYDRERPDLVLLDLALADQPGLDVLRRMRERDPDATVLVFSGNADVAAAVEAMRLGAENVLTKPIGLENLEAAVERALEKAALRRRNRLLPGLHAAEAGLRLEHVPAETDSAAQATETAAEVDLSLAEVERRHIQRVLVHHRGNRSRAARVLGISRATLYEKIRRYGLEAAGRGDAS